MSNLVWDKEKVHYAKALEGQQSGSTPTVIENQLFEFIQDFQVNNVFYYRDQLRENWISNKNYLKINLDDLYKFSPSIFEDLQNNPSEILELFESAVRLCLKKLFVMNKEEWDAQINKFLKLQIILDSDSEYSNLRNLTSQSVGGLVKIKGIVTSASSVSSKARYVTLRCKSCQQTKRMVIPYGFTNFQMPRVCDIKNVISDLEKCPLDPFFIDHNNSFFIDQQTIKIQEAPDLVPTGEVPKHMLLCVDRELINTMIPGARIDIIGIYTTFKSGNKKSQSMRTPYIRVVGVSNMNSSVDKLVTFFTEEEIEKFTQLSQTPNLIDLLVNSFAPSIYGNENIKRAILCLLFGGSKKILPDGMKLRGDINVLMLGDPGTAKSQLLKFTEMVAPISVYTSGKGSSAAGLTASVIRDLATGDFYLEGGAMVLADGGVVCIDEFDKMKDDDRVAIHEAMEQQTISIAKAGITTMLNSRASVLAAANPVYGRYDDTRSPADNIDFQTTILSRFDMIFIVRDDYNEQKDLTMARHVLNIHTEGKNQRREGEIDILTMKKYISYCKRKCAPRLTISAAEKLANHFVELRRLVAEMEDIADHRTAIPITIRQLEAITRISEAFAKMTLSPVANEHHVDLAIRLFKSSTMDAIQNDDLGKPRLELMKQVSDIEKEIKRRLPVGSQVLMRTLYDEFQKKGYAHSTVERAIYVLSRQDVLQFRSYRKSVYRCGV